MCIFWLFRNKRKIGTDFCENWLGCLKQLQKRQVPVFFRSREWGTDYVWSISGKESHHHHVHQTLMWKRTSVKRRATTEHSTDCPLWKNSIILPRDFDSLPTKWNMHAGERRIFSFSEIHIILCRQSDWIGMFSGRQWCNDLKFSVNKIIKSGTNES